MVNSHKNRAGFTLIEIMVAMAISGVLLATIYKVYQSQLQTYTTQQQVVQMQQSMRAALYLMERDIRLAGYAPLGGLATPIVTIANNDEIKFSMDITGGQSDGLDNDGDGDVDETTVGEEFDGTDNDSDGETDEADEADESQYSNGQDTDSGEQIHYFLSAEGRLMRNANDGNGDQAVCETINWISFSYLDGNGTILDDDGAGNVTQVDSLNQIRSVVVTLNANVGANEMELVSEINCRNLGLVAP